jgi:hypothetical protein
MVSEVSLVSLDPVEVLEGPPFFCISVGVVEGAMDGQSDGNAKASSSANESDLVHICMGMPSHMFAS